MSQKQLLMRTFNKQLSEFFEDVRKVFPDNNEIKMLISAVEVLRASNPSLVIKQWYAQAYMPYREQIDNGDYEFFHKKSYDDDLANIPNSEQILQLIDTIRNLTSEMSEENLQHSIKYIQILCKLSEAYFKMD